MVSINAILDRFWARTQSFELLHDSKKPGPEHHIFLVHGFLNTAFAEHMGVLEGLIVKAVQNAGNSQRIRLWAYRFDMVKVLSHNLNESLSEESQILQNHLACLEDHDTPRPDDSDESFVAEPDGTSDESKPESIVFIAHDLGSWIVKEVLAMPNSENFAFYPMGLVQLDASSDGQYAEYISRLYTTFNIRRPTAGADDDDYLDSSASYLRRADSNFAMYKRFYRDQEKQNSQNSRGARTIYERQLATLWMISPPRLPARTATWGGWFRGHSRGATLEPNVLNFQRLEKKIQKAMSRREDLSDSQILEALDQGGEPNTEYMAQNTSPVQVQPAHSTEDPVLIDEDFEVFSISGHVNIQPDNLRHLLVMARCFYQRSDFTDAEKLFKQYYSNMPKTQPPSASQVGTLMMITSLQIYRGKYSTARRFLTKIKDMIEYIKEAQPAREEYRKNLENLQQQRLKWSAVHSLRTGKWDATAEKLKKLIETSGSNSKEGDVQRDLALAYAYLGRYSDAKEAIELARDQLNQRTKTTQKTEDDGPVSTISSSAPPPRSDESPPNRRDSSENNVDLGLILKEQSIKTVSAEIHLLVADFAKALDQSSEALDEMRRILGTKHAKTLLTANIRARCLAFASRYSDAESLCLNTLSIARHKLGFEHPIHLETLELLVYIFRYQNRFSEAIDTGTDVIRRWPSELRSEGYHPLAIRCKYQLGAAHLDNGDYATAEKMLTEATNQARQTFGESHPDHPEILRFRSRLAHAFFCTGKREKARKEILEVADLQMKFYNIAPSGGGIIGGRGKGFGEKPDFTRILIQMKQFGQDSAEVGLHPFLILTMSMLVRIETRVGKTNTPEGKRDFIYELLGIITKPKPWTAADSVLISGLQYDLALALKEVDPSEENLTESIRLLGEVIEERGKVLGDQHLGTLCAKRDWLIMSCTRGPPSSDSDEPTESGISPERAETLSLEVFDSIRALVGESHPDTIKSQLWYITVLLLNQGSKLEAESETITKEVDDVIKRMESPSIRYERLVESLGLRMKIANLLVEFDHSEKGAQILRDTLLDTETAMADRSNNSMMPALEEIFGSLKALQNSLDTTRNS